MIGITVHAFSAAVTSIRNKHDMIGFSVKDIYMLQEFRMVPSSHVRSQVKLGFGFGLGFGLG